MKKQWNGFVAGVLVSILFISLVGSALATVASKSVDIHYNNIKVTLDGKPVNLVDSDGVAVEPFIINGTTYLPVRAVASALALKVGWDAQTKTVELTSPGKQQANTVSPDSMTTGQKNALKSAESYLSHMAFSYKRLVEQLEYEGYSHEESVYAADHCGADWYEQAAKSAKSYLSHMAFSRNRLIEQLEYEGFTHEQAVYGVEANGY